jgi:AraC family transcriptional regulator
MDSAMKPCGHDSYDNSMERLRSAVADLLYALSGALQDKPEEAYGFMSRTVASLRLESPSGAGPYDTPAVQPASRGGLAPWQIRKVSTHVEMHLDRPIGTADLAGLVKLSVFHFCRAFRASFDESPHTYLMRRRIERAQGMMLQTSSSLAQIAIECGLADQAHLNKSFRRFVGESPGAWRRARATAR